MSVKIGTTVIDTTECDKEIAAREIKQAAFASFLAWIEQRGWRFCTLDPHDRFYPVNGALVRRLLPTPDEGGSQELGEWLDDLPVLTLCEHIESNYVSMRDRVVAENGGRGVPSHWSPHEEADYIPAGWYPVHLGTEKLLAAYFGIDLDAASRERAAILAAYHAALSEEAGT